MSGEAAVETPVLELDEAGRYIQGPARKLGYLTDRGADAIGFLNLGVAGIKDLWPSEFKPADGERWVCLVLNGYFDAALVLTEREFQHITDFPDRRPKVLLAVPESLFPKGES